MIPKTFSAVILISAISLNIVLSRNLTIDKRKLSSGVEKLAVKYKIPDYSIALIYKDSLLFTISKDKENEGKNYLIGSCSKSFTALAVLKLAKEGKIGLDNPVKQYLPWFELKNKNFTDSITVRRLLNHKSGFERQYGFFDFKTDDPAVFEENLSDYIKNINVRFAPGSFFLYCNLNYDLLGLIIRKVTGQSYSQYLTENILSVAGMNNTWLTGGDTKKHNLIQPYHYLIMGIPFKSREYFYSDFHLPSGYISSNISDLSQYLRLLLHKTVTAANDTILTFRGFSDLTGGKQTGYAMGWFHSVNDSVNIIRHTGLNENFSTSLNLYPDQAIGWVVLCNVNSLEFCNRVDQTIDSQIFGKQLHESMSTEILMRKMAFIIPLILLFGLIYNLNRWKKYNFHIGFVFKLLPVLRLLLGILLSVIGLIFVTRMYQMFLSNSLRFGPDLIWGLILTAVFGILSSLARYLGTYSRIYLSKGK